MKSLVIKGLVKRYNWNVHLWFLGSTQMSTEQPIWASLVVYFDRWLLKEPNLVIYITSKWMEWLLEHFYGLRFWPIFDSS